MSPTGSITEAEPNDCYIEASNRFSGIWVQAPTAGFAVGDVVTAVGTLGTSNGERTIQNATLSLNQAGGSLITPFCTRNLGLGGICQAGAASLQDYIAQTLPDGTVQYQWQLTGGAPTVGLLTKTWGTVNAVYYSPVTSTHWFYLDDGSGVVSDFGDQGVLVYSDANVSEGDMVSVTGVSSMEVAMDSPSRLIRAMRTRSADDVRVAKKAVFVPAYPFSDEFDSPTLDPRWLTIGDLSQFSLTSNPGWLVLSTNGSLVQEMMGHFDLDIKVRPCFDPTSTGYQGFHVNAAISSSDPQYPYIYPYDQGTIVGLDFNDSDQPAGTVTLYCYGKHPVPISDAYWFRMRVTAGIPYYNSNGMYLSYSLDGITYSDEALISIRYYWPFLRIFADTAGSSPFAPMIDYFRVTRYDQ